MLGPEEMSPTCDMFAEVRNADISVPNISQREVSTATEVFCSLFQFLLYL